MKTAVEIYAVDFLRLIVTKRNTNFCDVCNRRFGKSAYYRYKKSNIHLAMLHKKSFQIKVPLTRKELSSSIKNNEDVWCV